jgi:beta-lactamase regulating signal transducer with metallopeptidase domain
MLAWMLYAITVSLLLTLAATCAAHSARLRGQQSRFIWAACLALSLLIPAVIPSVSVTLPRLSPAPSVQPPRTIALRNLAPTLVAPASLLATLPQPSLVATLNAALPRIWAALSLLLAAAACANAAMLAWRKRSWTPANLAGTPVLLTADAGPALAGLLFPKIVVPAWLLDESAETQRHVIAHERAHLAAGDTHLLASALALLILMRWNLPLWWQLRGLRLAIETDCDARLIAAGAEPTRYAETLIGIGEHRARPLSPAMAMAEPVSTLEKRIRLMLRPRTRRTTLTLVPALAAAALALGAAGVSPPNAESPADLGRFTGTYQMGPSAVLSVTQQDGALFVRLTGQPSLRVTPQGPATFTADSVGARFDFTLPDTGPATSVTLHQNGQVIAMARVSEAQAHQIETATSDRIARNTPAPGSQLALTHLVDGIIAGTPDYDAMTPKLAAVIRAQLPTLHDGIAALGPVQSITFVRVGEQGQDIYRVKQKQGDTTWRIVLAHGKIAGALVRPAE